MSIFETLESEVRSYCRSWPVVFDRASGSHLYDSDGNEYLDFFAGAGALNYGHNPPDIKHALLEYLERDGVVHSLDMHTAAKAEFLERFRAVILEPRDLDYKVMFPGPTGTNAVEAALKLARKATGRETVVGFTNAFHGMTLGSLAITGSSMKRQGAGVPLGNAVSMPYDDFLDGGKSLDYFEAFLVDGGSGVELPALVIVETVQAEGGINVASFDWLRRLEDLCRRHGILFAIDDIQAGCGRTGPFFSFEAAGLDPDIVCLSKSLSGYGLPLAITLMKPAIDVWAPGEHTGTFRGSNPAFVTATAALERWTNDRFSDEIKVKGQEMGDALVDIAATHPELDATVRGRGMIQGLAFADADIASRVARQAFAEGVLAETSGPDDEVLKLLPPLVIEADELEHGLKVLAGAVAAVADDRDATFVSAVPSGGN